MKSYRLMAEDLAESLKKLKAERMEGIKEIKGLYAELENKQVKPFDQVIERISKNLQFFKDAEYKASIGNINPKEVMHKYDGKLQKINDEIFKLDKIIKNGCGNIVEKPATSRIKSEISAAEHKELSHIEQQQS